MWRDDERERRRRGAAPVLLLSCRLSQEIAELLGSEPGVSYDTAHRERVHRIVSWDDDETISVRHHHVLSLPNNPEPCLSERAYRIQVIDSWDLAH
jgi:hypothetical protein